MTTDLNAVRTLADAIWRVETRDLGGVTLRDAEAIAEALLAQHDVVELPEPEWDDDGQAWFADCDIRVDLTGSKVHHRAYVKARTPSTAAAMRAYASELLAAAKLLEEGQAR